MSNITVGNKVDLAVSILSRRRRYKSCDLFLIMAKCLEEIPKNLERVNQFVQRVSRKQENSVRGHSFVTEVRTS